VERLYTAKDAEDDERAVIEHLHHSGWIEKSWESNSTLMIQWTEKGKTGAIRLNELYEEAGAGRLNGRQVALFGLIAFASHKVGMDGNNVTAIGDTDLSRENLKTDAA
jgi:hypothetical protein